MRIHPIWTAWGIGLYLTVMLLVGGQATAAAVHNGQTWQGVQNCLACHESEAIDMHGSSHYQWQGQALYTINGPAVQGKLNTALNSYCISILGNWNACGSCHVGLGAKPEVTATPSQLQNIDCLICHQKDYKRKKDTTGFFVPDTANMPISMDQAVQTVHKPVRSNCVQCHAKGGGGDNNKRGDMALAHAATADRNFDVHMSSTGANLTCQQCHTTESHRIAGRGSDLRQTDLDVKINCSTATCHANKMTVSGHVTADVNRHVNRVACQTCHIKTYARNASDTTANESTEIYRNWTTPEWVASLNRWEPLITRGSDLKPVYTFWNGTSWNYSLKETAVYDATTGTFPTSRPEGGINDTGSRLYPFKYKKALQPIADSLGMLVALDTSVYFSSGNYDNAVKAGLTNMGFPSNTLYRNVDTDTYQLITHEVMPKGNALTCTQCHTSTATQMNLKAMGYAMKETQGTTCTQCHGNENIPSYTSLHNRHVTSNKYDCSWCHSFSRPERGLKMPAGIERVLSVSPAVRDVSKYAGQTLFSISNTGGTTPWTAQVISGNSWLRITSGASGTNAGSVICTFDANTETLARTGTIRVTATGAVGSPKDVTVIQAGTLTQPASQLFGAWSDGIWYWEPTTKQWAKIPSTSNALMIAAGKVDTDNVEDLIGVWPSGIYVRYSSDGQWMRLSQTPPTWITAGDLNNDGRDDVIGSWSGDGVYYRDSATGKWIKITTPARQLAVGNIGGNGRDEMVGVWESGLWVRYSATGAWQKIDGAIPLWITSGDMMGRGRSDIIGSYTSGTWYRDSVSAQWIKIASPSEQLTVGDIDGDGRDDLIGMWSDGLWVRYGATGQWQHITTSRSKWITTVRTR